MERPWVMRVGKSGMASVLVCTSRGDALEALADELAGAGYYAFVAVPSAAETLAKSTVFDLILVLRDVDELDREMIKNLSFLQSANASSGLVLTHIGEENLVAVLRERLDPMHLIDE